MPRTPCYQTCHVSGSIYSDCSDLPVHDLHPLLDKASGSSARVIDTGLCVASQTLVAPKKAKRLGKAKITYGKNSSEIADWATGSGTHTFWNRLRNNQCEFSHRQNLRIYMQM